MATLEQKVVIDSIQAPTSTTSAQIESTQTNFRIRE